MEGTDRLRPKGYRIDITQLVLSTFALNILTLALPVMTLQVYDRILPNPDSGTLPVLMAGVTVAVLVEAALRLARTWLIGWNGAVYEHGISSEIMEHITSADLAKTSMIGTGEFLNRLGAVIKLKDFYNGYSLVTWVEMAFVPLFLGVIFYIAKPLVLIPVILLTIFAITMWRQGKILRCDLEQRDRVDDIRYDYIIECLKGIHTVKAFAIESLLSRRYEGYQEKSGLASLRTAEASTASFNMGTLLSHLMMAAVATAGAICVIHNIVTTGALIATLQLSGRLMQPVQRSLVLWAKYQDYAIARKKVGSIFDLPKIVTETRAEFPGAGGKLEAQNISFGSALKDVNLKLEIGDVIAISGDTGKTELLEILAGLYPPDMGKVIVDGLDVHTYPPQELVRHVGHLTSEGVIFRGTIRDNITGFGALPLISAQELARLLHVDRDVARLPAGFDTPLQTDGADQIPPGLRQRIAMTRILAARPKIILFDEADRALDREGYNLIFSLLAKLSRKTAMVLVSEDANITSLATRHYVLHEGRLEEKIEMQRAVS